MKDQDQKSLELLYEAIAVDKSSMISWDLETQGEPTELGKYDIGDRGWISVEMYGPSIKSVVWFNNDGQAHRADGPAKKWSHGITEYWVNDKIHRLDGPAVIDGQKFRNDPEVEYRINDESFTEEQFNNHPLVKAYKLKQKLKDRSTSDEENVLADMFA